MKGLGGTRGFWTGFGAIVLVGLFLSVRAGDAMRTVLGTQPTGVGPAPESTAPSIVGAEDLARRDSLLAAIAPAARDPFRESAAPPPPGESSGPAPPRITGRPALRALLFDNINPSVQVSVGSSTSGWLHVGDSYLGWTIVEIQPNAVRISGKGESLVLQTS